MSSKCKALIIDDDPSMCESLKAIMEGNGFEADIALSGADGLEAFRQARYDIVLCDMMMEDIDAGVKVATAIKKERSDVPVFLLSTIGRATTLTVDLGDIGFDGAFQKPIDFDLLLSVLGRCSKSLKKD